MNKKTEEFLTSIFVLAIALLIFGVGYTFEWQYVTLFGLACTAYALWETIKSLGLR